MCLAINIYDGSAESLCSVVCVIYFCLNALAADDIDHPAHLVDQIVEAVVSRGGNHGVDARVDLDTGSTGQTVVLLQRWLSRAGKREGLN